METRYQTICKLLNEEIDEILANTDEGTPTEMDRDDLIVNYLDFLKKELVSDNG